MDDDAKALVGVLQHFVDNDTDADAILTCCEIICTIQENKTCSTIMSVEKLHFIKNCLETYMDNCEPRDIDYLDNLLGVIHQLIEKHEIKRDQ